MDIGNIHKKIGKDRVCVSGDTLADIQTDTQTYILITILRNHCYGEIKIGITIILNSDSDLIAS